VADCCEHGNEPSSSIKGGQLSDCQLHGVSSVSLQHNAQPSSEVINMSVPGYTSALSLLVNSRNQSANKNCKKKCSICRLYEGLEP
jgi:hypothetical protein